MKAHLNLTLTVSIFAAANLMTSCGSTKAINQSATAKSRTANQATKSSQSSKAKVTPVLIATVEVPAAGDDFDTTKGDIVTDLVNKVSCFQPSNDLCVLMQTDRSDVSNMEKLCEADDFTAGLEEGNSCADLDITAKCNIEIKGDRFTIYNIGGLSKAKESALAKECAGVKVDGKVFKGTFVTVTDEYTQNLAEPNGNFLEILKKIFEGIFSILAKLFQK